MERNDLPLRQRAGLNATLIVVCQSMQALAFGGVALFLPIIRDDVHISFSQAGTLAAVSTFTYAVMQIPAGYLADRFDPKTLFIGGLASVNVLSMSFASLHDYGWLVANQAVSGICRALVFAPGLLLMQGQFRPDRKATAMGLYVAGGFSSNILLNAIGPVLVGPIGWRWLFVAFSVSGLLVLIVFAQLGNSVLRPSTSATSIGLTQLLRHRVVWLTGFIQFVRLAVVTGTAFWLPSLIVDDKGYSLGTAGVIVAIGAAVTAPSNFLGGLLSDRFDRPLLVIGVSLFMLAVTLAAIPHVNKLPALIGIVAVNSVFVQLYFGPLFAVPLQHFGAASAGTLAGFGNFCANLGGFASTFGLGAIKDATGSFDIGLYALAGLCVVGVLAIIPIGAPPVGQTVGDSRTHPASPIVRSDAGATDPTIPISRSTAGITDRKPT